MLIFQTYVLNKRRTMIYTVTLNPALDYFMNYESLALGEVNRTGKTQISAGGKGIMESRMLSLVGAKRKALGFLGGFSGQYIKENEINYFIEKFDYMKEDDIDVFAGTITKSVGEDFYERLIAKVQKQK